MLAQPPPVHSFCADSLHWPNAPWGVPLCSSAVACPSTQVSDEVRRLYVEATPLGRLETPEDVAAVAVFLASADSDFMTGVAVDVNGGAWMG